MKGKYIKPSREAIAKAKQIPGLNLLEQVLAAEAIAFTDKLIERVGEKL